MGRAFFAASEQARSRVTGLFDFLWPVAAGAWNLRWQVAGFVAERPDATESELNARFASGSGIISRAAIRRACIDETWETQLERFAGVVVVNLCSIYEGWCDELLREIDAYSRTRAKALQYPSAAIGSVGAPATVAQLAANASPVFEATFCGQLRRERHYSGSNLDDLLLCYRYFKELRNCLSHTGGVADSKAEKAYGEFRRVATMTALSVKEVPEHHSVEAGKAVRLSLRGVTGLGEMVLKIIRTVDADLVLSDRAEKSFKKRWAAARAQVPPHVQGLERIARKGVFHMHLPLPAMAERTALYQWVVQQGLV